VTVRYLAVIAGVTMRYLTVTTGVTVRYLAVIRGSSRDISQPRTTT
jgi:hypothetical protein